MWGKAFWKETRDRVIWTVVEVAAPLIPAAELISAFDYAHAFAVIGLAALAVFLKQVGLEAYKGFKAKRESDSTL